MSKVIAVNQQKPARVVLAGTRGRPGSTIASATVNESDSGAASSAKRTAASQA